VNDVTINSLINFFVKRHKEILSLLLQHLYLTFLAVGFAILVGIPLGILIARYKKLSGPIIGVANVIQAIPSLALLGFLIPFLGIGTKPSIFMVLLYSLLPIIKNCYTALVNIDGDLLEAAKGMGMTKRQVLFRVQIPLAMPVIMAGIRISAVTAVGLMTIAAFVGAGGLGDLVFRGVQSVNNNMIIAGALPACLLALVMDFVIGRLEKLTVPKGIR